MCIVPLNLLGFEIRWRVQSLGMGMSPHAEILQVWDPSQAALPPPCSQQAPALGCCTPQITVSPVNPAISHPPLDVVF